METIRIISALSGIVAIVIGFKSRGLLWYYVSFSFLCDALGFVPVPKTHYNWYVNTFFLGEFLLIGIFLLKKTIQNKYRKYWYILLTLIGVGFLVVSIEGGWERPDFKVASLLYAFLIPLILFGFYRIMTQTEILKIERSPLFIFCAGFLLYISGSFLMMLFEGVLHLQDRNLLDRLWAVHNILNIIKNFCIAYCLLLYKSLPSKSDKQF